MRAAAEATGSGWKRLKAWARGFPTAWARSLTLIHFVL
jgi:hypothetical protein